MAVVVDVGVGLFGERKWWRTTMRMEVPWWGSGMGGRGCGGGGGRRERERHGTSKLASRQGGGGREYNELTVATRHDEIS